MATLRIYQDQENVPNGLSKQPLRENNDKNVPLQQKRPVLGVINKNKVQTRTQSQLTKPELKYQGCKNVENKGNAKSQIQTAVAHSSKDTFVIHEDQPSKAQVPVVKIPAKSQELSSAVVNLHRHPLQELASEAAKDDDTESCVSLGAAVQNWSIMSTIDDEDACSEPAAFTLAYLMECNEYRDDIYDYLLHAELRQQPKPYYMKKQPDITYAMRAILVDWLVEVAGEYKLHTETLYLAVSFLDRFLSVMSVIRSKLQLVGTAAMFIASKYEEIYPPDVSEFVYITDDTYTKSQVLRMEHLILKVLAFDLSIPTTHSFIISYCSKTKASETVQSMAMYLSELSLMVADPFFDYVPSIRASSCIALARHTLYQSPAWSQELEAQTGYTLEELIPCIRELNILLENAPSHPQQAIRDKYKSNSMRGVSATEPRSIISLQ